MNTASPERPALPEPPEIEELERTAAWRLRLVDANAADETSQPAAALLERIAADLREHHATPDHAGLWTELRSLGHYLGESGLISDYADFAADYRGRIGVTETPADGAAYLRALLAIARGLL